MHVEAGVALGMRRLSIIDLSTGQQPIHNEDGTIWVVFNGEIYNYRALRAHLEARGHCSPRQATRRPSSTHTRSGAKAAFARLRGMFGIALWNARTQALILVRDRVGIKPLHYAVVGDRLYFGSEIKSILAGGEVARRARCRGARPLSVVPLHAPRRLDVRRHPQAAAWPCAAVASTANCACGDTGRCRRMPICRSPTRKRSRCCADCFAMPCNLIS